MDLRFSVQMTAVIEDAKTTFSMVSVWAQASKTLWAALTSTSAMNSCSTRKPNEFRPQVLNLTYESKKYTYLMCWVASDEYQSNWN